MIPFYGCIAGTGKIYSLDDPLVVKDVTALDGSGGVAFSPYLISTPLGIQFDLGYNRLRRFLQRLAHGGAVTTKITGIRDGQESGLPVTRALTVSDIGIINAPLGDAGSDFQIKLELSAYDASVALGNSDVYVVGKRRFR